jgi:hypothetical protein
MKRTAALVVTVIALCIITALSSPAAAQRASRPAYNAALRYWMAFAQMNDSPISAEDAARMDLIVNGKAPWDEQQFGPLVEQNKDAIETMIRGTSLPACDWGIEYDLGPDAPIAHLPKARALARLNRLYAERLASTGDYGGAIRATVAGIHFARHMAQNASFLGALTAKVGMVTQLEQVRQLAASGHLSSAQLAILRVATRTLPEGGFDWEHAARLEGGAIRRSMTTMSRASDPKALYQTWFGSPAPPDFRVPGDREIAELDRTMAFYGKLLGMPPATANTQLPALQKQIAALDAVAQMTVPNAARMIAARAEVINAQHEAGEALGMH